MGSTENFWRPHKIGSGRDQPGNPTEQSEKHPGFKAVQSKIAKQKGKGGKPLGKERAGAILAARSRAASPAAKKANPNLKRVKGY